MIGNYILSGKIQAVTAVVLSALVSLIVPPLAFLISGSVVALLTLRKGSAIGLQVLIAGLVVLQVFSVLAGLSMQISLTYALLIWLPVWISATVLRLTQQQGFLILVVALLAIALIIVVYVSIGDVSGWWQKWLEGMLEVAVPPDQVAEYRASLGSAVTMLNAMMTTGLMLNIIMAVLYARWWQSRLFNLRAFQKEFYALRLPPAVLVVSAIIILLAFMISSTWQEMFQDILVIVLFMYFIQGISAVHRNINKLELSIIWLVLMYCLLILWRPMGFFIACLGMGDVYIAWRGGKKLGSNM